MKLFASQEVDSMSSVVLFLQDLFFCTSNLDRIRLHAKMSSMIKVLQPTHTIVTILIITVIVGPRHGDVQLVRVQDFLDGVQSGAVEVRYNMEWRRVCDPKSSSTALATTVCRQLGYNGVAANYIL